MSDRIGVLFVCLGNICRSPLAEAVFLRHLRERGLSERFDVDSCGTGPWHVGRGADPRSIQTAARHGTPLVHTARQFDADTDPERFEWILAMDRSNRRNVVAMGAPPDRVFLFRRFDPALAGAHEEILEVPDPYHGGDEGFEHVFSMVNDASLGLLEHLARIHRLA